MYQSFFVLLLPMKVSWIVKIAGFSTAARWVFTDFINFFSVYITVINITVINIKALE